MARIPAAIRAKNPGAMWPGPISKKWGSTKFEKLNDGTGQGNKIAYFDTWHQGICAQLDLWRSSSKYKNKRFKDAIHTWSGGNHVPEYIAYVKARIPRLTENTIMNDEFWASSDGAWFLKVQAMHEAGQRMPVDDQAWFDAQKTVMSGKVPVPKSVKAAAAGSASNTVTLPVAVEAANSGMPWYAVVGILLVGVAIPVFAAWWFSRQKEVNAEDTQHDFTMVRKGEVE